MENEPKKAGDMTPEIMQMIGDVLNTVLPEKMGFALVLFDFGEGIRECRYVSNGQREDMIGAFRTFLNKWELDLQSNKN